MAALAANSPTLLRAGRWIPGDMHCRQSRRLRCIVGQSGDENKIAVAHEDVAPVAPEKPRDGASTEGSKKEGDEEVEDEGDDLRGPSVEEAKAMAKRQGQVDAKIMARRKEPEAFTAPYRTKRWALTRNKGAAIGDLMIMYGGLLDRGFGSGQIIAASGRVVIDKVRKDAKKLMGEEGVREVDVLELLRAMELLEAELKLVRAAEPGEPLFRRLEEAKKQCKVAFTISNRI